MTSDLKISVIIPTYNQGQFIEETILSILNQTYKNFEIIVIDGGSNDSTGSTIEKYKSHFSYFISEKDSGQSEAINKGLAVAKGNVITWLNSDDCYMPDALEIINSEFLKNPGISIIHGKAILFGENISNKTIGPDRDIPLHEYLAYMRFPQPSSFLRTEVFRSLGNVNNSLHYVMDFDLIARAILAGFKLKRIDAVLSRYRLHKASKTNDHLAFAAGWSDVVYAVLNSQAGGDYYAKKMTELKVVLKKPALDYKSLVSFSGKELESIFLLHLNTYYHSHYQSLHKEECTRISRFLKNNYPIFYVNNNFRKYDFRLKFIPKFVFDLFRTNK